MPQLYALYEHASGYALFRTTEFEEIAVFLPQVQSSILNVSKFRSIVYLIAFQSFETTRDALENMKSISEGVLNKELLLFLENNVPKTKKSKQSVVLGVQDATLAAAISETLGIDCATTGAVAEIIRGIRYHFSKLVKGFKELSDVNRSELALGHHYSRVKTNFDAKRADMLIIQTIDSVDQLEKDISTLSSRVMGWYSYHFPELKKLVPENNLFIQCVKAIGDRKAMPNDIENQLNSILGDNGKVQTIIEAASRSMGMDISHCDVENIESFTERITSLMSCHQGLIEYIESKMKEVAPNLSLLVGEMVGARLISRAGGLAQLVKMPPSTIQVLGAPKGLFRCWKPSDTPMKHGLLHFSPLVKKTSKENKKHMARFLANKSCLAARADFFSTRMSDKFGQTLLKEVEDNLKSCQNKLLRAQQANIPKAKTVKKTKRGKKRKKNTVHSSSNLNVNTNKEVAQNGNSTASNEVSEGHEVGNKVVKKRKSKMKMLTVSSETEETSETKSTKPKKRKKLT